MAEIVNNDDGAQGSARKSEVFFKKRREYENDEAVREAVGAM